MIAAQALPAAPERSVVQARDASRRRYRRSQRRGYVAFARVGAAFALIVVPFMAYVTLMANLTSLSDKLAHATAQRTVLLDATSRLDDRIAQLESRERLAAIAARLKMHDPRVYAVIDAPRPLATPAARGIAFLGGWLTVR
jgi:hypothetical protein